MANGIFREEGPAMFLRIMVSWTQGYVSQIEKVVLTKYKSKQDPNFIPVMSSCLEDVRNWCPKTRSDEYNRLISVHRTLPGLYQQAYVASLLEVLKTNQERSSEFEIPLFADFYILFLGKLSSDSFVRSGRFNETQAQSETITAGILREAILDCIEYVTFREILPLSTKNVQNAKSQTLSQMPSASQVAGRPTPRSVVASSEGSRFRTITPTQWEPEPLEEPEPVQEPVQPEPVQPVQEPVQKPEILVIPIP